MTTKPTSKESKYTFGAKDKERIGNETLPVTFKTSKYMEAKNKAIELIESGKYPELSESDFWTLVNSYKNKTEAMYSGLIISHDGCLKINEAMEPDKKFKPECVSIDKDGYKGSLVFTYCSPEQGLYEVGEANTDNLKLSGYPYAMAFKRCFDRVVLKLSKIAFSGIYSDSESEDFKEDLDTKKSRETKEETSIDYKTELDKICKAKGIEKKAVCVQYKLNAKSTQEDFKRAYEGLTKEVENAS